EVRLADRREHPGGDRRGTAARPGVVDGHPHAPLGAAPRRRQPDHTAADDGHVGPAGAGGGHCPPPTAARSRRAASAGSAASLTAPTTATPYAPAASRDGTRSAVTPPIAMTGVPGTAAATAPI